MIQIEKPSDEILEKLIKCPYLRVYFDPSISYYFPNAFNYCHRGENYQATSLQYQDAVCLRNSFKTCVVLSKDWNGSFPEEMIRKRGHYSGNWRRWIGLILISILIPGLLIAILLVKL